MTAAHPSSPSAISALYLTDRADAPYRYRCLHPCLQLRSENAACDILHIDDPRVLQRLPSYSIIILFRLPASPPLDRITKTARQSGAKLVFDIDDLVFDPDRLSEIPFLHHATPDDRRFYAESAQRLQQTLSTCDAFIGPTPALLRAAQPFCKAAFLHPNLLHPDMPAISRRIVARIEHLQRFPLISYLSGSRTHDDDLASIAAPLARVLQRRTDARLLLCGFVRPPDLLQPFTDRIIRVPFQHWRVLPWLMRYARVNLAPLAAVNDFTHSKSALKFLEAAIIGLPTIATPTEPFCDAISHAQNGFLASNDAEWESALETCLSVDSSRRIGHAARQTAITHHASASHARALASFLSSLGGQSAGPARPALDVAQRCQGSPLPIFDERLTPHGGPGSLRRLATRLARTRAILGIIRRAHRPWLMGNGI